MLKYLIYRDYYFFRSGVRPKACFALKGIRKVRSVSFWNADVTTRLHDNNNKLTWVRELVNSRRFLNYLLLENLDLSQNRQVTVICKSIIRLSVRGSNWPLMVLRWRLLETRCLSRTGRLFHFKHIHKNLIHYNLMKNGRYCQFKFNITFKWENELNSSI